VLLVSASARAATVVIVRPAGSASALTETVSRLQGELLSLGLDVVFAERPAPGADAVIEIGAAPHALTADIQVLDRRTGQTTVSRVALEPSGENAPARLAIRTIEVLRSGLLEIDLAARNRPKPVAVQASPAAVPETRASAAGVALEAGAAVLTGADGVGPALLPTVRVAFAIPVGLVLDAALAGFGSRPTLTAAAGSARVAQQFGLLGVSTGVPSTQRIRPYLALAAGVLRTAIEGQADAPAQAHVVDRWSFLLEGSAGARVRLPGQAFFTLAAHVQVAAPYVQVHIADTVVATTGRPNFLFRLTVGAWL
jgi:hypothetical protein